MTHATRGPTTTAAFGWRRGATYALLLSVANPAPELAIALAGQAPVGASLRSILVAVPGWFVPSALVVAFAAWAIPRASTGWLVAGTVLVTLPGSLLFSLLSSGGRVLWWPEQMAVDPVSSAAYQIWVMLFYGGLFVATVTLAWRSERTQQLLGRAEVARQRGEALLHEAELEALRGSVDPRFVLRVVDAVASRFATDAAGADRLLDRLVAFLRLAMPGVRHGASTLGAEVAVWRAFEQLATELEPGRRPGSCQVDGDLASLAFPSLALLPLLDTGTAPAQMTARREGGRAVVRLGADAARADAERLYRLRVGLQALHGAGTRVVADATQLSIELPLPAGAAPIVPVAASRPHPTPTGAPA